MLPRLAFRCQVLLGGLVLPLAGEALGQPLNIPQFGVVSATYRDLNGDQDPFPDSGETGRLVLRLRNGQFAFTGAALVLSSPDPEVDCISEWKVVIGDLAPGQIVDVGSLDPLIPGFAFKVAASLASLSGADPARVDLCVRLLSNQSPSISAPYCFFLPADLDLPGGATQTWIAGPDGAPGTTDDGTLLESFDADRDGDGLFTVNDTFRLADAGTGLVDHGAYMRASEPAGGSVFSAVRCNGYYLYDEVHCMLDPDYPMDWHLHCPPGATNCPNTQSSGCSDHLPGSACTYATPADGRKASSPPNSLHMGVHFAGHDSLWDTTRFRSLAAYRSGPINLTPLPRPGDLTLSMFHIADLMDDVGTIGIERLPCVDCGDVQIQIDRLPDPAIDDWGPWEKLVPFQNVYDHVPAAFSAYAGGNYCVSTPTDAGSAPPAPYGFHETLCFPQGAWSSCGSVRGTAIDAGSRCDGPGLLDPSGSGVWVESRFDLSPFLGQRIRIRWIANTWVFDDFTPHYNAAGGTWAGSPADDGWWIDDIRITGVITSQTTPVPDSRPPSVGSCPVVCTDIDGDGYGAPAAPTCPGGPGQDCDDLRDDIHPGAPEGCNRIDNDCDGVPAPDETDDDFDGKSECQGDCNDADYSIGPGRSEENDGRDNQCPGDPWYGLIDELDSPIRLSNTVRLFGFGQFQATAYQVVRSGRADFSTDCTVFSISIGILDDPATPALGEALHYVARPTAPHVGSWGYDSSRIERVIACVP